MKKAVAYTRVSTTEQAKEGVSLDAQETRLRAYCTLADLELVDIIREEGVSASKPLAKRAGGAELLRLVESKEATHVVALKLDRLFRDAIDALTQTRSWEQAGISLHLVDMGGQALNTGSAMGRMFLTIAAAFAELERNLISERTSAALQELKSQGMTLGAPALGESSGEQETVSRILELRNQELTLRAIAERLTEEGHETKRGGRWGAETVRKVLRREGMV